MNQLVALSTATELLAQARSLDEVKQILDLAEAARTYARAAQLGNEAYNHAAEIKLRAERKAGEMLAQLERGKTGPKTLPANSAGNSDYREALIENAIPERTAERWQQAAEVPEPTFEATIQTIKNDGDLITAAGIKRRLDVHFSSNSEEWSTPADLFAELDHEFHFTLDVCASAENAKCAAYFNIEVDGLKQEWTGVCWMNPPYGDVIEKWVTKADESSRREVLVVSLVPARVDTNWWWNYCRFAEIRFLRGRLRFGNAENSAPFPSAVVIFGRPQQVIWWERGTKDLQL